MCHVMSCQIISELPTGKDDIEELFMCSKFVNTVNTTFPGKHMITAYVLLSTEGRVGWCTCMSLRGWLERLRWLNQWGSGDWYYERENAVLFRNLNNFMYDIQWKYLQFKSEILNNTQEEILCAYSDVLKDWIGLWQIVAGLMSYSSHCLQLIVWSWRATDVCHGSRFKGRRKESFFSFL